MLSLSIPLSAANVMIEILKPTYDGGSPISGYVIQVRNENENAWKDYPIPFYPVCTIEGLKEGDGYFFRVRAVNKYGVGDPGEEKKVIRATEEHTIGITIRSGNGVSRKRSSGQSTLLTFHLPDFSQVTEIKIPFRPQR